MNPNNSPVTRWLYTGVDDTGLQRINPRRQIALLAVAAGLLYVLPTLFETMVIHNWDPWLTLVGLGDAIGCAWLAIVFRKPRLAMELYMATALVKVCLFHFHMLPHSLLPLLADFVPTMVVLAIIWISPSQVPAAVLRRS